ncbi:MAG: hypothetical protein AB7N73_14930 [Gemmatimonadales bacterium]
MSSIDNDAAQRRADILRENADGAIETAHEIIRAHLAAVDDGNDDRRDQLGGVPLSAFVHLATALIEAVQEVGTRLEDVAELLEEYLEAELGSEREV